MKDKCILKLVFKSMFWMVMAAAGIIAFVCMDNTDLNLKE